MSSFDGLRAIFNGNLRASILETLVYDRKTGQNESVLAKCCGVARKAVWETLDHLEFCQMVRRGNVAGRVRIMLIRFWKIKSCSFEYDLPLASSYAVKNSISYVIYQRDRTYMCQ